MQSCLMPWRGENVLRQPHRTAWHFIVRCRIIVSKGALDMSRLGIIPGKRCWNVFVDVMVIDSGGSLLDTISLATYAALNNTK